MDEVRAIGSRKRRPLAPFLIVGMGIAVFAFAERGMPHEQVVHFVLGDRAHATRELRVRYAEDHGPGAAAIEGEDWTREATFRYPQEGAPRVITHEPRLKNGDYVVEIEALTVSDSSSTPARVAITRHVKLAGGPTSIELAHDLEGK